MGDCGRIINVSSTAAQQALPAASGDLSHIVVRNIFPICPLVYSASKAAVESITRVLAVELRDKGIRVTSINPGPVFTDKFFQAPIEQQEHWKATVPVAKPEDIADIVVFLAGPKSRWVNGGVINANNALAF